MNLLTRYWKTGLMLVANMIYTYIDHSNIIKQAVKAEVPVHYHEAVMRHMKRAIDEKNKPKDKFPAPYFYVPGKGEAEQLATVRHDFKKTYTYNQQVDRVMEKAGIKQDDAYTEAMKLAPKYL